MSRRRVQGIDAAATLNTLNTAYELAACHECQGKHVEAAEMLQRVLVAEQRTKGPDHADMVETAGRAQGVGRRARGGR